MRQVLTVFSMEQAKERAESDLGKYSAPYLFFFGKMIQYVVYGRLP